MKKNIPLIGLLALTLLSMFGARICANREHWEGFGFSLLFCNLCLICFCLELTHIRINKKLDTLENLVRNIMAKNEEK